MRNALIAAIVVTVLAGLLDAGVVKGVQRERALAEHGVRTMAKVVSIENPRAGVDYLDSPKRLIYEYKVGEEVYRGLVPCSGAWPDRAPSRAADASIEIVYLPEKPTVGRPVKGLGLMSVSPTGQCKGCWAAAAATVCALFGWAVVFLRWRKGRGGKPPFTRFEARVS